MHGREIPAHLLIPEILMEEQSILFARQTYIFLSLFSFLSFAFESQ